MLDVISKIADIVGGAAVAGAVIFALVQVRQYRQQRRDTAAVELMRTIQSPRFTRAHHLLSSVPEGVRSAELGKMGAEYEEAALTVVAIYEPIGLLVFRGVVPFPLVRELTGGVVAVFWRTLATWVEDVREERDYPRFAEWLQWLAERLEDYDARASTEPAHERFASWRPPS
jgi:hypothetical protein